MKGQAVPTGEKSTRNQSNIDLAAHNQTLKQQRQLNGRNHHISINTNTNINLKSHQKTLFGKLD
jgi:hypothetical protein